MEVGNILDPGNEDHLFALHYIFLPRIQRNFTTFAFSWNNHSIRTENHRTPMQLWIQGSVENINNNLTAMHSILRSNAHNEAANFNENNAANAPPDNPIIIPGIVTPHSDQLIEDLRQNIDPLAPSAQHAVDLYGQTLQRLWEFQAHNL
ncbi:hypothetical protein HOLleu_03041 [Holothuria leucospilota]|uniref:Integrase core domain-containing protein n=1 Tax=Holothuria leucospilota TaxID=206669 RepID=A0A9Q1HHE5_HOLLE|nr:hypothetical protein HOLleu_03041 [Holothuria leucospilota]